MCVYFFFLPKKTAPVHGSLDWAEILLIYFSQCYKTAVQVTTETAGTKFISGISQQREASRYLNPCNQQMFLILPFWVPCECLRSSLMLVGWRASSPCSGLAGKLRMAVRALLPGLQVGDATWKVGSSCQSLLTSLYEVCTSSPRCWFWWGVALCILQAAAEGRQRLLACLLLDISQNGWRE